MAKEKDIVIHMDINSPEWKEKIGKLNAQLDARDGDERHTLVSVGYRKQISCTRPK